MKSTLIVTVGTSILFNINKDYPELMALIDEKQYSQAAKNIIKMEKSAIKALSAELNTALSMIESGMIETVRMYLIASDSDRGKTSAALLEKIFSNSDSVFDFNSVETVVVNGLKEGDFTTFRRVGLKNLVSEICTVIRKFPGSVAINNTGGYKAEIAFAGIIGQAFGVPVYYQHEDFTSMIELPPLPISVDVLLWKDNLEIFMELKEKDMVKVHRGWLKENENLQQLIDTDEIDKNIWIALNPAGHLFVQACEYNMYKSGIINMDDIPVDKTPAENKEINFAGDHHGQTRLLTFGKKICRSQYIKRILTSMPYHPHASDPVKRIDHAGSSWFIDFVMTETDAGYTLRAETTARNFDEAKRVAARIISEIGMV